MSTVAPSTPTAPPASCLVSNLITYAHVADVEASLAFYAQLGFVPQIVMREAGAANGSAFWARARAGTGEIMFARASGTIDANLQAVLFYMYSADVAALRNHLLASGVRDGGSYTGSAQPSDGPSTVFNVGRPHYMPAGELRITDPDGYIILVGQLA